MEVRELAPERFDEASLVMADAYLDDPGWVAVGPDDPGRRHRYTRRICRGGLAVTRRWGGPIFHVERDGAVAGVLTTFDPPRWPPPAVRSLVYQGTGPLLAGPRVLARSLKADHTMTHGHPEEPHVYIWMLTVAPAEQRSGIGRALLGTALERADEFGVVSYLETAKPDNLPYYSSFGFGVVKEEPLPRGARIWFMERTPRLR